MMKKKPHTGFLFLWNDFKKVKFGQHKILLKKSF